MSLINPGTVIFMIPLLSRIKFPYSLSGYEQQIPQCEVMDSYGVGRFGWVAKGWIQNGSLPRRRDEDPDDVTTWIGVPYENEAGEKVWFHVIEYKEAVAAATSKETP